MKVALIVPTFPQPSETFIVAKAVGLHRRGVDVHVVCRRSDPATWAAFGADHPVQALRDRVHVAASPGRRVASLVGLGRGLTDLRRAPSGAVGRHLSEALAPLPRRLLALASDAPLLALAPDVVHFEFGSLAPARMDLRERLDAAATVSFRGYDINYSGIETPGFYDPVWERADGIHVLGEDIWRRAVRRGAPANLNHTVITPALDASGIEAQPARPGPLGGTSNRPLRVLSVGRLHWKKGYEHALDAVAELRNRGAAVEYRIVGGGELSGAVGFWKHQLGLDDAVRMLGALPPGEVGDQYAWADVMLHAATSEGFCNAVLEAQAHGVPVVCTDADGLPENVEHEATGIVVPRRDATALADGLGRLARDGDLRAAMGRTGQERARLHFGIDDHLDAWVHFYAEALARRRSAEELGRT